MVLAEYNTGHSSFHVSQLHIAYISPIKGKSQNQWLKQQYEKQIQELQNALRTKEAKLRDLDKVKSRVAKQKQEIENQRSNDNDLHAKMCEQTLELKRDLQLHQTRYMCVPIYSERNEESAPNSVHLHPRFIDSVILF